MKMKPLPKFLLLAAIVGGAVFTAKMFYHPKPAEAVAEAATPTPVVTPPATPTPVVTPPATPTPVVTPPPAPPAITTPAPTPPVDTGGLKQAGGHDAGLDAVLKAPK